MPWGLPGVFCVLPGVLWVLFKRNLGERGWGYLVDCPYLYLDFHLLSSRWLLHTLGYKMYSWFEAGLFKKLFRKLRFLVCFPLLWNRFWFLTLIYSDDIDILQKIGPKCSSFLNRIFSQSDLFSIGSFLNRIFSQLDLFGVATLCYISTSQEQRNVA